MVARVAVFALLLFTAISSLRSFPDFLAYSNELAGGPSHTYRIISDSNADWGQGLKWTKSYLDQHPASDCWFDSYNPLVNPAYYGIQCKPLLTGFGHLMGMGPAPMPSPITGTVFVSGTEVTGLLWGPGDLNPYQTFRDRQPDATIGNVILVYRGTFDVPLLAAQTNALAATNLLRQHHLPEAVALAQTAVQQAPNSAELNATLGWVLLASGRIAEGQQAIATAIHLAQTIHPEYQKHLVEQLQRSSGGS
jgi:Tetratricopeptide repeat